jgi:hypothetical protein
LTKQQAIDFVMKIWEISYLYMIFFKKYIGINFYVVMNIIMDKV